MELKNCKPYAAGKFYSENPDQLESDVKELFNKALPEQIEGNVLAVICPHAGYVFSGQVAATSLNQIDTEMQYTNIFIIGSSHSASFKGASVYCNGNYETPLGEVKVNLELANKLIEENSIFKCYPEAHQFEHSLEVQLPLLQYHMKADFQIIPIIIGSQAKDDCKKIADALYPYFNGENLFIISTDFSHYPSYQSAKIVDLATAEAIKSNNPDKLLEVLNNNDSQNIQGLATSLCGWTSVLTLLYITQRFSEITIDLVQYKNSGDSQYGDHDRVVGYYSIAFSKKSQVDDNEQKDFNLNKGEKKILLGIARNTISEYISNGTIYKVDPAGFPENLKTPCGAFVSLHQDGNLRGCIGRFDATEPLYKVIQDMAISAATKDYRFARVETNEIDKLDIEISVLTPLKKINSIDEFELGRHGIYIKKGYSSGTFLPQVATSTKWTKEEFLGHCARDKAGIGWDGWKNAELFTYEALILD